jgi:hypothetical protein
MGHFIALLTFLRNSTKIGIDDVEHDAVLDLVVKYRQDLITGRKI